MATSSLGSSTLAQSQINGFGGCLKLRNPSLSNPNSLLFLSTAVGSPNQAMTTKTLDLRNPVMGSLIYRKSIPISQPPFPNLETELRN